jgi:hypothetical protein
MQNLIYFPTFEPPTQNWLKFALLYVENFNPIIPQSASNLLSTDYQKVIDNTDLITPYRPRYDQGDRASIKAIEFIEKIRIDPYRFTNLFNIPNFNRVIGTSENQRFKIYEEKFSMCWMDYCIKNNYGKKTRGGILTTKELAFIFMTFLAEEIAFEEGKSIITDNNNFDNFLNYKQTIPRNIPTMQKYAQGVLSLSVPKNISTISFRNLIKFRNENRSKITAFNTELNNSLNNIQDGKSEQAFVKRFNNIYSELTSEVLARGAGIATIPLATYLLLQKTATSPEYVKEIIGGLGILLTSRIAINSRWKDIANKRDCKRYLTNLERLN